MISNIIDRRKYPYKWAKINAVIEATSHDNDHYESDHIDPLKTDIDYEELEGVSISDAVLWAEAESDGCCVTLFLYDENEGTTSFAKPLRNHF